MKKEETEEKEEEDEEARTRRGILIDLAKKQILKKKLVKRHESGMV